MKFSRYDTRNNCLEEDYLFHFRDGDGVNIITKNVLTGLDEFIISIGRK